MKVTYSLESFGFNMGEFNTYKDARNYALVCLHADLTEKFNGKQLVRIIPRFHNEEEE